MDDFQSFQGQPRGNDGNDSGFPGYKFSHPPGGDHLHLRPEFGPELFDHAFNQANVSEQYTGLQRLRRISPDNRRRTLQAHFGKFGGASKQRVRRNDAERHNRDQVEQKSSGAGAGTRASVPEGPVVVD